MALRDKLIIKQVKVINHLVLIIVPRQRNLEATSLSIKFNVFKKMFKFKMRAKTKLFKTKLQIHLKNWV